MRKISHNNSFHTNCVYSIDKMKITYVNIDGLEIRQKDVNNELCVMNVNGNICHDQVLGKNGNVQENDMIVECDNTSPVVNVSANNNAQTIVQSDRTTVLKKISPKMIQNHTKTCGACERRRQFMEDLYKLDMYGKDVNRHLHEIEGRDRMLDELFEESKQCFILTYNL